MQGGAWGQGGAKRVIRGGASHWAARSASRGAAGDRAPEAAAGSAPTAQRRPHPEPLQREHQAEAGVGCLRPRHRPQMASWLLRLLPTDPCICV